MKSKGNYFYFKKLELKTNFTQIPNELLYVNLSATEKLILVYLLSNSQSFRVTHYRIEKAIGSDHRTVKKAIKKFQDMKLIVPVASKTFGLNMDELMKLAQAPEIKDEIDGNSTNSISTNGQSTDSNATISNCTTTIPVQLPVNTWNSTTNSVGELPNNNSKQQELKEEKQKEASLSDSLVDIQDEVEKYLKTTSKFFYDDNQYICSRYYERFLVEYPNSKISSLKIFQGVLYFYLLRLTNSEDVQELNENLSKGDLNFSLAELSQAVQLIRTKQDVYDEYKEEVNAV